MSRSPREPVPGAANPHSAWLRPPEGPIRYRLFHRLVDGRAGRRDGKRGIGINHLLPPEATEIEPQRRSFGEQRTIPRIIDTPATRERIALCHQAVAGERITAKGIKATANNAFRAAETAFHTQEKVVERCEQQVAEREKSDRGVDEHRLGDRTRPDFHRRSRRSAEHERLLDQDRGDLLTARGELDRAEQERERSKDVLELARSAEELRVDRQKSHCVRRIAVYLGALQRAHPRGAEIAGSVVAGIPVELLEEMDPQEEEDT